MATRDLFTKDISGSKESSTIKEASFDSGSIKQIQDLSFNATRSIQTLDLNNLLLSGQLSGGAGTEPVSEEEYAPDAVAQNAVIRHVAPIEAYLTDTVDGLLALRKTLGLDQEDETDSLIAQLESYIQTYIRDADALALFPERDEDERTYFPFNIDEADRFQRPVLQAPPDAEGGRTNIELFTELKLKTRVTRDIPTADDGTERVVDASPVHTAIFTASKFLLDDTLIVQRLRHGVVRMKRDRLVLVKKLRKELDAVQQQIQAARRELAVRNRTRLESLGDLHLAQQLVREDWSATEARFAARQAVLDAHQGLYYARVRETAVSQALPDPLPLLTRQAGDLLPGCGVPDKDLPEELEPFIDAVLDIPMADWATLRDQYPLLPGRKRLDDLYGRRQLRLDWRIRRANLGTTGKGGAGLAGLRQQNISLLQDLARRSLPPRQSLRDYQLRSRELLSLEDLLTGPNHRLRGQAAELRDQLNQATHCLLARLRGLPPGIRLAWAEGAEEDRGFVVEEPERWPGLERAEAGDFTAVRTLVEVVNWWFRQLHAKASGNSRSAMRNLVRACLLLAASDDPEDILHGQLKSVPGRFRIGEAMRLDLNREAVPGTRLRLLDANDKLIGSLRVDDEDDQGTVASITEVFDGAALLTTGFRVTGYRFDTGAGD